MARTAVSGTVDGWGYSLGSIPAGLTNAIAVSAGLRFAAAHSLALRADGTVVAWSNNIYGQCNVPTNLADVVAIAAGGMHSIAAKRDGTVVVWGNNDLGQITNAPADLTNVVDVKAGLWHSLALRSDGTIVAWGDLFNHSNSVPPGLTNVIAISAGPRHCLALKSDHTVVGWGFSYDFLKNYLPTNVPAGFRNVVAISAGMEHNQALLADGTMVIWGRTNAGPFQPAGLTNLSAISARWFSGLALGQDASMAWDPTEESAGLQGIVAMSAGTTHCLVIRTNYECPAIRKQPKDLAVALASNTTLIVEATSPAENLVYQWRN